MQAFMTIVRGELRVGVFEAHRKIGQKGIALFRFGLPADFDPRKVKTAGKNLQGFIRKQGFTHLCCSSSIDFPEENGSSREAVAAIFDAAEISR